MSAAAAQIVRSREMVMLIFSHLERERCDYVALPKEKLRRKQATKTLARLARVCQAFSAPALDLLWRVLDDIWPILALLPPLTCGYKHTYVLSRDITQAEWDRLQSYARRVRELDIDPHRIAKHRFHPSIWTFLARWCPQGRGLLPCLEHLETLMVEDEDPARAILLLSPALRHLSLEVFRGHPSRKSTHNVDIVCDIIKRTVLKNLSSMCIPSLAMFLAGDPNCDQHRIWPLQTLEITEKILLDGPTLKVFASFRELKKLCLSVTLLLSSRAVRLTGYPNTFTALKELELTGDPPALREVLQLTSPPHLQSLDLNFDDWSCSTHDEGIRCTHAALSAVTACTTKLTLTFGEDGPRVAELIQPALAFYWLTEVRIALERHIPELVMTDTELRALADAWPALTVLELDLLEEDPGLDLLHAPDRPRARTLVHIAARHPRLERFVLPFLQLSGDALPDPHTLDALDSLFPLGHGLQRFRVRSIDAVTNDARANEFALFLDRLFPHLDFTYPEPCYDSDWYEIERLLIVLQKARRNAQRLLGTRSR